MTVRCVALVAAMQHPTFHPCARDVERFLEIRHDQGSIGLFDTCSRGIPGNFAAVKRN